MPKLLDIIRSGSSVALPEPIPHPWAKGIPDANAEVRHVAFQMMVETTIWPPHILKPTTKLADLTFPEVLKYISDVGGSVASFSDVIRDNIRSSVALARNLGRSEPQLLLKSEGLIGEGLVYLPDGRMLLVRREYNPILRNPENAFNEETSWLERDSPKGHERRFYQVPQGEASALERLALADAKLPPEERRAVMIYPRQLAESLKARKLGHYDESLDGPFGNQFITFTAHPGDIQHIDVMRFLFAGQAAAYISLTQESWQDHSVTLVLRGNREFYYSDIGNVPHSGPAGKPFAQMLSRRFTPELISTYMLSEFEAVNVFEEKPPSEQIIRPNNTFFREYGTEASSLPMLVCAKFPADVLARPRLS